MIKAFVYLPGAESRLSGPEGLAQISQIHPNK
jgi:hypothetical protein